MYSTRYIYTAIDFLCSTIGIDHLRIDNWSPWHALFMYTVHVHVHVSLALWLTRVLLKSVSYTLVKLKMPGTSISRVGAEHYYFRKAAIYL